MKDFASQEKLKIFIFFFLCMNCFAATCFKEKYYKKSSNTRVVEDGNLLGSKRTQLSLECLELCNQNTSCDGANYNHESKTCDMYIILNSTYNIVETDGSTFFFNKKCPFGYLHKENSCYKIVNQPLSWNEANSYCQMDNASLISLETEEEYENVKTLITEHSPELSCDDSTLFVSQITNTYNVTTCSYVLGIQSTRQECLDKACELTSDSDLAKLVINYGFGTDCNIKHCTTTDLKITLVHYAKYDLIQFIGGRYWTNGKEEIEGQWEWTNGKSLAWGQGELDDANGGSQDCLSMLTTFPGVRLNDEDCNYKYHFICETEMLGYKK